MTKGKGNYSRERFGKKRKHKFEAVLLQRGGGGSWT